MLENVGPALLNHVVHQVDQIAGQVRLLVLLGKGFDYMVHEVFQQVSALLLLVARMQCLQELFDIFFAVRVSLRLVD